MADEEETETTPESNETVALRAKLDQLERQNADYKSLVADVQNSGRRLREDAEKQRKFAAESLCRDLLSVYDNLERALSEANKADDTGSLAKGVAVTLTQFLDTLKRHGVTKIVTVPNSEFDPNLHMAVMQQAAAGIQPGRIVQVLQQGFLLHDRVIRPASVIVAAEAS
jgi:molecular chaperone GrpE